MAASRQDEDAKAAVGLRKAPRRQLNASLSIICIRMQMLCSTSGRSCQPNIISAPHLSLASLNRDARPSHLPPCLNTRLEKHLPQQLLNRFRICIAAHVSTISRPLFSHGAHRPPSSPLALLWGSISLQSSVLHQRIHCVVNSHLLHSD